MFYCFWLLFYSVQDHVLVTGIYWNKWNTVMVAKSGSRFIGGLYLSLFIGVSRLSTIQAAGFRIHSMKSMIRSLPEVECSMCHCWLWPMWQTPAWRRFWHNQLSLVQQWQEPFLSHEKYVHSVDWFIEGAILSSDRGIIINKSVCYQWLRMGITWYHYGGQTHWVIAVSWIIVNATRETVPIYQRVQWDVIGLCFVMADEVI